MSHAVRFYTAASFFVVSLYGCGPVVIRDAATGKHVSIQRGSFELRKTVEIPAGRTRIYFQSGRQVRGVNEFQPHCQLEVNTILEQTRDLEVDVFAVTSVATRSDQVVMAPPAVQVAVLGGFGLWGAGESRRMYVYVFGLRSDRQPDVRSLNCGGAFDVPMLAELPTLQEVQEALGEFGTLRLQ